MIPTSADAVLAHDRVAGCMRLVPAFQCLLIDAFGDDLTKRFEIRAFDAEAGWFEVDDKMKSPDWFGDYPRKRIHMRGLQLIVAPDAAKRIQQKERER